MAILINDIDVEKRFNLLLGSADHVAEAEIIRSDQNSRLFTTHPKHRGTLIDLTKNNDYIFTFTRANGMYKAEVKFSHVYRVDGRALCVFNLKTPLKPLLEKKHERLPCDIPVLYHAKRRNSPDFLPHEKGVMVDISMGGGLLKIPAWEMNVGEICLIKARLKNDIQLDIVGSVVSVMKETYEHYHGISFVDMNDEAKAHLSDYIAGLKHDEVS